LALGIIAIDWDWIDYTLHTTHYTLHTNNTMTKTFSASDVATHNKPNDLYVVVDEDVYDLTTFQDEHPGIYPSSNCPWPGMREEADGGMMHRRQEDTHPRRRKGRLEAILEIPQRVHSQEIQSETPNRLSGHEESLYTSHSTCNSSAGGSETSGGEWSCGSDAEG
jgi:hypothetical protein